MSRDYVPHSERRLVGWASNFISLAQEHAAELRIDPDELAALVADHQTYNTAYEEHEAARVAALATCATKDNARADFTKRLREIAQLIQAQGSIPVGLKTELGLTVGTPTPPEPLGVSGDRPLATIDAGSRWKHILRFKNRTDTGTSKAKPAGVLGCEIYVKVGDAPTSNSDLSLQGIATRSPYVIEYSDEDGGKQAHYMARWVTRSGEKGSWAEVQSATIAA